jgi:two-component system sensor histidine kinase/response regulator
MGSNNQASKVLIVDDMPANLDLLERLLLNAGYDVLAAPNGRMALRAAKKHLPDLIMLDVKMPGMDGYAVCKKLKENENLRDIPVVFLSGLSGSEERLRAYKVGGLDFVTKPFTIEEVLARVKTYTSLTKTHRELDEKNVSLQEALDRVKAMESHRDNLNKMISHDIVGPLHDLSSHLNLIKTSENITLPKEEKDFLNNAISSSIYLNITVTSILDINRLKAQTMPVVPRVVDLRETASTARSKLRSLAASVNIKEIKTGVKTMAYCDQDLTSRVITTILANAQKFSPAGGKVEVSFEEEENSTIKVTVMDSGRRILPSSTLGLTFCKLAVEAQGGKIGQSKKADNISEFWFTLPSAKGLKGEPPDAL